MTTTVAIDRPSVAKPVSRPRSRKAATVSASGLALRLHRHCEERSDDLSAVAQRAKAEAIHISTCGAMDCFAEPVIGRR
jgi:hypothetical protein